MGESDTRIMERFGTLLLKFSLSLFFIFFFYVGPRSRATAAHLGLRHSSEAAGGLFQMDAATARRCTGIGRGPFSR